MRSPIAPLELHFETTQRSNKWGTWGPEFNLSASKTSMNSTSPCTFSFLRTLVTCLSARLTGMHELEKNSPQTEQYMKHRGSKTETCKHRTLSLSQSSQVSSSQQLLTLLQQVPWWAGERSVTQQPRKANPSVSQLAKHCTPTNLVLTAQWGESWIFSHWENKMDI